MSEEKFYEICKMLVTTDTFNKDKSPYILCTAVDSYTQNQFGAVEFDYKKVYSREDKYKDVVGFYHTHPPGCFNMSSTDVETMKQWVGCLGKSLICLIECEGIINAWVFKKGDDGKIFHTEVKASSTNDINYYVWSEPTPSFWENADFLLQGEGYFVEDEDDPFIEITDRIENLEHGIVSIITGLEKLTEALEVLIEPKDEPARD